MRRYDCVHATSGRHVRKKTVAGHGATRRGVFNHGNLGQRAAITVREEWSLTPLDRLKNLLQEFWFLSFSQKCEHGRFTKWFERKSRLFACWTAKQFDDIAGADCLRNKMIEMGRAIADGAPFDRHMHKKCVAAMGRASLSDDLTPEKLANAIALKSADATICMWYTQRIANLAKKHVHPLKLHGAIIHIFGEPSWLSRRIDACQCRHFSANYGLIGMINRQVARLCGPCQPCRDFASSCYPPAAVGIARDIYEKDDAALLSVLGDCLSEGQVAYSDLATHCRTARYFTRGNFVVDQILGKC